MMPMMMKAALKSELNKLMASFKVEAALKAADREYEGIIARTPNIGGDKNPFLSTLYVGAYAVAVYKMIKGDVTVEALGDMIADALNRLDLVKKLAGKTDYLSPEHVEKERENARWLDAHTALGNWAYTVEGADENALVLCYRSCGLYEMVKREKVPEVAPVLCRTDKMIYGLSGYEAAQEKSFEDGGGTCVIRVQRSKA